MVSATVTTPLLSAPVPRVDPAPGKAVVLYDGDCPFCRKSVSILKRLDWLNRLHLQNARDTDRLPPSREPLVLQKLLDEMHVVTPDRNRAYAGFRAFRWMAWRLPAVLFFAPFLYLPGVLWAGNRVYRWVAKHRYSLVPCDDGGCRVPLSK
jgi:predicted DCC family thiol-disulfide oxidoreductase YuxK